MQAHRPNASPHARHGITMIEAVMLIVIIVLLAALILPAISHGRRRKHGVRCINNLSILGRAVRVRANLNSEKLPHLVDTVSSSITGDEVGWPRGILAQIDQTAIIRRTTTDKTSPAAWVVTVPSVQVPVFTCPDDTNSYGKEGGLSYRANNGYANVYRATSDPENEWSLANYRRSGVMFSKSLVPKRVRLDEVDSGDGVSNTLLLAERSVFLAAYSGVDNLSFGLWFRAMNGTEFNTIGVKKNAIENVGTAPGPTYAHSDYSNVVFCDGHTASLSHSIDKKVYAKLLSHAGSRNGEVSLQ